MTVLAIIVHSFPYIVIMKLLNITNEEMHDNYFYGDKKQAIRICTSNFCALAVLTILSLQHIRDFNVSVAIDIRKDI